MITRKIGYSHPLDIITKLNKTERGKMRKNNITLSLENIISFFRNITSHFTGKEKIITLVSIIIMLSFVNITLCFPNIFSNSNVSALSYQSNVGVSFTFNPTLSVNISPSNLTIDNLAPGTTSDSNVINISVATNAAYGYTLSAIVNGNNSNLTHTNGTNVFSSIDTDANLSSLTTDNTWGYSYKLSNDTNWNNYSGLSTETSKTLVDSNDQTAIPIDFKIGAKAASTQASGTYTNTINFTAVTKHIPVTLAEAYASEGKTMINGFYTMQDMTTTICSKVEAIGAQLQVLDKRDNKLYWIAKLADNKCWMTQNLDLDLDSNRTYTHWDTDLGWNDPDNLDINANWKPDRSTIDFTIGSTISGWQSSNTEPYSANPGDVYFYTSNSDANDIQYDSLQECVNAGHNDCTHYHAGNYYNWSAAVANSNIDTTSKDAFGSICPSKWEIFRASSNDFGLLLYTYKMVNSPTGHGNIFINDGFNNIRKEPLYAIRSGLVDQSLSYAGVRAAYWLGTNYDNNSAYYVRFNYGYIKMLDHAGKGVGRSVRCLAR